LEQEQKEVGEEVTLEDLAEVAKEVPEVVYLPFGCLQQIIILI
jgi:hypothetical protein